MSTRLPPIGLAASKQAAASSPAEVDVDTLLDDECRRCVDYVFPQAVINRAFLRVIVYAKYGPGERQPDGSVKLMCGGRRAIHHFEEKQLYADEESAFITDTYGGSLASASLTGTRAAVDSTTFGEMNRMKNPLLLDALEMTRAELTQVLAGAKNYLGANSNIKSVDGLALQRRVASAPSVTSSSAHGSTPSDLFSPQRTKPKGSSHIVHAATDAVSTALLAERRRRISVLRCAKPQRDVLRTDANVTHRQAQHFYNKTAPKAYTIRSFEDPKDVLRSLHRSVCLIVDPANRSDPSVTLNVRCLRPDFVPDPNRPGWDGYCCTRNSAPSKVTTLR